MNQKKKVLIVNDPLQYGGSGIVAVRVRLLMSDVQALALEVEMVDVGDPSPCRGPLRRDALDAVPHGLPPVLVRRLDIGLGERLVDRLLRNPLGFQRGSDLADAPAAQVQFFPDVCLGIAYLVDEPFPDEPVDNRLMLLGGYSPPCQRSPDVRDRPLALGADVHQGPQSLFGRFGPFHFHRALTVLGFPKKSFDRTISR